MTEKTRLLYGSPLPAYSINPTNYKLSPEDPYAPQYGGINSDPSDMSPLSQLPTYSNVAPGLDVSQEEAENQSDGEKIFEPHARKPFIPDKNSALAYRMRYYNKLSGAPEATEEDKRHFEVPAHVIPSDIFFPDFSSIRSFFGKPPTEEEAGDGETQVKESKRGDIALIFSIWNTMMGSSLLALPWGFTQAGLTGGLLVIFVIGFFCCYTCVLILKHGKDSADFFYLCNDYLGKIGKWLCWASSLAILVGGLIAYDILMSDTLFSSGSSIANIVKNVASNDNWDTANTGTNWWWNEKVTPIIIFVIMYPICNMKSFSIIVMINSFGVIPIIYTVIFIVSQSIFGQGLVLHEIPEVSKDLFVFAGLLSVSFYVHGLILPIMKSAKNPHNNVRNLIIGYILVAISYSLVGAAAYAAYWYEFTENGDLSSFPQEFLQIFTPQDTTVWVIIANILLLFQLATVFPLLLLIIRIQFFGLLFNSQYPGALHVFGLNFLIIAFATLFALFFPNFGTILSITGAICGTVIVFYLPILVHLKAMKQQTGSWGILRTSFHVLVLVAATVVAVCQFFL